MDLLGLSNLDLAQELLGNRVAIVEGALADQSALLTGGIKRCCSSVHVLVGMSSFRKGRVQGSSHCDSSPCCWQSGGHPGEAVSTGSQSVEWALLLSLCRQSQEERQLRKVLRKEEKREKKQRVRARDLQTAAEDHEAELRAQGFDPQFLRLER